MSPEFLLTIGLLVAAAAISFIFGERRRTKQTPSSAHHASHPHRPRYGHRAPRTLHTLHDLEPLHARRNWMQQRLARAPVDLSKPFVTEADWRALRLVAEDDDYLDALGKLRLSYQFSHPMLLPQSLRRIMMKWHCDLREAVIELAKYDMLHES